MFISELIYELMCCVCVYTRVMRYRGVYRPDALDIENWIKLNRIESWVVLRAGDSRTPLPICIQPSLNRHFYKDVQQNV